jgi:hypothetical protein
MRRRCNGAQWLPCQAALHNQSSWPFHGGQQAKLRCIIDNELPPLRKVPRRPATAAERHAAAEMGRAMSAAHGGGGEYPDLQPGVGFSRFDHPGWR